VQFDEKWSFVRKKQKHCKPGELCCGDCWDHVAIDPQHRLVLSVVVGPRTDELTLLLVRDLHQRTEGRLLNLLTSDEHPAYAKAILEVYGKTVQPQRQGKRGPQPAPIKEIPQGLVYATVHKIRENNRVVGVEERQIYGSKRELKQALARSKVSDRVTTVHIERHNGSDRARNARKTRKTYRFSKDWDVHVAVTFFTMYSANFCRPVRTLRVRLRKKEGKKKWRQRTPAMAAGLADHIWTMQEWLSYPSVQR
jgi:IS1 family transposase